MKGVCRTMAQVIAHQLAGHAAQRLLRRGHLDDDVSANVGLLHHARDAADLCPSMRASRFRLAALMEGSTPWAFLGASLAAVCGFFFVMTPFPSGARRAGAGCW